MSIYLLEVSKIDVDNIVVLKRKPILKPFLPPDNLGIFNVGFIERDRWGVIYKTKEDEILKNYMLFLRDKHMYSIDSLNRTLRRVEAYKSNSVADMKCISDMLNWWIVVRRTLLKTIPKVFEVAEKEKVKTTTTT